jgi:hypothetical protein
MTTVITKAATGLPKRDAARARGEARERVETAERVANSVDAYHGAADRLEKSQTDLREASRDRAESIRDLRSCRLTIADIAELTGLSSSRVQALLKDPTADQS